MINDFSNLHVFKSNDVYLAVDAATLSVFKLDENVAKYLEGKDVGEEEQKLIESELYEYLQKGFFQDIEIPEDKEDFLKYYNISIQNTLECPLNCEYCFAKKIHSEPRVMSKEMAHDILEFMFKTFDDKADTYEVYFTSGGEPLSNFDIIKQVYEEGTELSKKYKRPFKTGFTTNSVLLDDEKLEYLQHAEIGLMQSIDGTKEEHDTNRKFYNGKGSFDYVVGVLDKLKNSDNGYLNNTQALTVLTPETESYVDLLKYLVDLGYNKVDMKLVRNIDKNNPIIKKEDLGEVKRKYKELVDFLTDEILHNRFKYVLPILDRSNMLGQTIIHLLLRVRVFYRCDAGKAKFSILPNGDIYPCDYFSTDEEFKMGNIYSGLDLDKRKQWVDKTCVELKECKSCWARYLCAGSCYYSRYINDDKPDYAECESIQFLIEQVAGMIYKIREVHPNKIKYLRRIVKNIKSNTQDE